MADSVNNVPKSDSCSEGVSNEHELLKDADISDDQGMLKYGIDLTEPSTKNKI